MEIIAYLFVIGVTFAIGGIIYDLLKDIIEMFKMGKIGVALIWSGFIFVLIAAYYLFLYFMP